MDKQSQTKLDAWTQSVIDVLADAGLWTTSINARLAMAAKLRPKGITAAELASVIEACKASCGTENAKIGHAVNVLRDQEKLSVVLRSVRRQAMRTPTSSSCRRPVQATAGWDEMDYQLAVGALVHHDRHSIQDAALALDISVDRAQAALDAYLAERRGRPGRSGSESRPLPAWLQPKQPKDAASFECPF